MASSYAALVSLINILNRIQHPTCPAAFDKLQIQSLFDKANFLVDFLEPCCQRISEDFARKMVAAAFATEDMIESYIKEQIPEVFSGIDFDQFFSDMDKELYMKNILEESSYDASALWGQDLDNESCIEDQVLEESSHDAGPLLGQVLDNEITEDKIPEESSNDAYSLLCQDLDKAIREMDIIIQEMNIVIDEVIVQEMNLVIKETMKVQENGKQDQPTRSHVHVNASVPTIETIKMVGLDNELTRLMGELTGRSSDRLIIPIVGMGGIGKTTLAKNVYNHKLVNHHFDVKAWVTISQEYTPGTIMRPLLRDLYDGDVDKIRDTELGVQLHKCLYSRKYLVILDDIWDTKAYDEIIRFCPNNNGSRLLLTTRILDLATQVGSCSPFDIKLLNDDQSWVLLSETVFGKETCPLELEECGKKISKNCKGLPLTITVIGGLLKMSEKSQEYWDGVAENTNVIMGGEDGDNCLEILSLSYRHLPIHLKPCFLFFATYPEDHEIHVSELVKLWAADGLVKSNVYGITLEEVALKCLTDLTNRNLIMVKKLTLRGGMKSLTVHDLVRELCMKEVRKERFLYVDSGDEEVSVEIGSQRRLVFRGSGYARMQAPGRFCRSFMSFSKLDSACYICELSLLRVCFLPNKHGLQDLEQLVNLRLLKISIDEHRSLPKLFWNLETLIVDVIPEDYNLPIEIWSLQQIKHLIFTGEPILPDPPAFVADFAFQNLQTLEREQILSGKVLEMIPNIKKLGIKYGHRRRGDAELFRGFDSLAHCHKLETLRITTFNCCDLTIKFGNSLTKLILSDFDLSFDRYVVGSLPNLEVLELFVCNFVDGKWNSIDGEFQSLKFLTIAFSNLETWTVEECCHFPTLQRLDLIATRRLQEIPEVFGESTTLESMKVDRCSTSSVISAKHILDEQQSFGNYDLIVHVNHYLEAQQKELKAELQSFVNDNFKVVIWNKF